MSKNLPSINTASNDTVQSIWTKLNNVIALVNTEVVTANTSNSGAYTVGNGYVFGTFGSNTLVASLILGGNTVSQSNLTIGSNLSINSSSLNVTSNVTFTCQNTNINSTVNLNGNVNIVSNTSLLALSSNSTQSNLQLNIQNIFINTSNYSVTGNTIQLNLNNFKINSNSINISSNLVSVLGNTIFSNSVLFQNTVSIGSNVLINTSTMSIGTTVFSLNGINFPSGLINSTFFTGISNQAIFANTAGTANNTTYFGGQNSSYYLPVNGPFNITQPFNGNTASFVGSVNVGSLQVYGNAVVNGNMSISGNLIYNGVSSQNFIPTTSGQLLGNSALRWEVYANSGNFANQISIPNVVLNSNTTTVNSTIAIVDQFSANTFRSVQYFVSITDNNSNSYHTSSLLAISDGNTAYMTEYAVIFSNTSLGSFSSNVNAGTFRLLFQGTSSNSTLKIVRTLIGA